MQRVYALEKSLQANHIAALSDQVAQVRTQQANARKARETCVRCWYPVSSEAVSVTAEWVKETLSVLVQGLKGAFSTFFGPHVSDPGAGSSGGVALAPWLSAIIEPDAQLDLEEVTEAEHAAAAGDLDNLEGEFVRTDYLHTLMGEKLADRDATFHQPAQLPCKRSTSSSRSSCARSSSRTGASPKLRKPF